MSFWKKLFGAGAKPTTPTNKTQSQPSAAAPAQQSIPTTRQVSITSIPKPPDVVSGDIFESISDGDLEHVKKLLDDGISLEIRNKSRCTPLIHAALYDKARIVRALLKRGADTNATDVDGYSALWFAKHEGYHDIVTLLESSGGR